MPRKSPVHPCCHKTLLALAAAAALAPCGAWAVDLAQSPPGSVEPYIRPNVIISVDDSGSMGWRLDKSNSAGPITNETAPDPVNGWPASVKRMNILKYSLGKVFNDTGLLPDKKIRLAWQAMNANNGNPGTLNTGGTAQSNTNSMKVLSPTHRTEFLKFVNRLTPNSSTPSHKMLKQADEYMRLGQNANGPWATDPGTTGAPYLGCRRNFHVFMTDGRWNGAVSGGSQDDHTKNKTLDDGTVYGSTNATTRPYNKLYHDTYSNNLADWAFYSWAEPLQTGLSGSIQQPPSYRKAPATESFGNDAAGNPAVLERYWNPRYDPAIWPHMVTYTIGFSNDAVTWPGANEIKAPTDKVPFGYDGSFPDFVTGNKTWPKMDDENKRALDLWHAALNGRGRFYAVNKADDLERAFREIFGEIGNAGTGAVNSSATSGSNMSGDRKVGRFTASYFPADKWKGTVVSEIFASDGSVVSNLGWGGQSTADKLDAAGFNVGNRLVLGWSNKMVTNGSEQGGVSFKWASDDSKLSNAQKLWLQTNIAGTDEGATAGQQRLDYIRGDRSLEGSDTAGYPPAKPYRERRSRQGDIINSNVWYTGAPSSNYALKGYAAFTRANKGRAPMIYVGGNDGMLHGFAAADGTEKIAYVPKGSIPALRFLTAPIFNDDHRTFVDGSPMTGDVDMGVGVQDPADPGYSATYAPDWRTLLVGTLGAGGKGYFVLDVTNPDGNGSAPAFDEANAAQLAILDRSRSTIGGDPDCVTGLNGAQKAACALAMVEDQDIGHITVPPVVDEADAMRSTQITRMNNNRWAVVLGNGYNSANLRPVLLIQYLDGARELLRIPTTTDAPGIGNATDNGLSAPRLVDLNGDGRADVVYAGDNLGNLWKFDLTNLSDSQWKVAFGGSPLFTARGPASLGNSSRPKVQHVTAAPTVRANDRMKKVGVGASAKTVAVGGLMVAFGTGRNAATDDPDNADVQTLYSVLDNTHYCAVDTSKGKRLNVHTGGATDCDGNSITEPIPTPTALGTGVTSAKLAQQKITDVDGGAYGKVDIVNELKTDTWANFNGWYMDFPAVGERLLSPMALYDGSNLLTVFSKVPAKGTDVDPNIETCDWSGVDEERQYFTLINIMDGKRPSVQIVDYNHDNVYNAADAGISRINVPPGPPTLIAQGDKIIYSDIKNTRKETLARMPEQSLRPSWRQVK